MDKPILAVYRGISTRFANGKELALFLWGKELKEVEVFILQQIPKSNDAGKVGVYFDEIVQQKGN